MIQSRFYPVVAGFLAVCVMGAAAAFAADQKADTDAKVQVGKPAPKFSEPNQHEKDVSLGDLKGKWVVLYFYPKDDTPGCTIEACDFTDSVAAFQGMDAVVLGASPDSPASHRDFIKKHGLKIDLLADQDKSLLKTYGALSPEGKVVRSTVIIDPQGRVAHHWPKVSAKGHAAEVKAKLEELQSKKST